MTWPVIVLIFIIASALVFALGIKIGEEKTRNEQTDDDNDQKL